jgi:hypothetical protein
MPLNTNSITTGLESLAENYENALDNLMNSANSSTGLDISTATVQTAEVGIEQSLLEMYNGGVQNIIKHLQNLARKIN